MKKFILYFLCLLPFVSGCQNYDPCEIACTPKVLQPYPVIIGSGQSNWQGADPNVPTQYQGVLPNVKIWENDNSVISDYDNDTQYNNSFLSGTMSTAIPLADSISKLLGQDVAVFSVARGGTTLCDLAGRIDLNASPNEANDLWHLTEQSWTKFVAYLATQGYYPDIQMGVWWQGFADGGATGNPAGCSFSYYDNLSEWMFEARNLFNMNTQPFFVIDSADTGTNNNQRVRDAKIQYSGENGNTYFIPNTNHTYIDPSHVDNATHINVANEIIGVVY